jgi:hypothetical protein
MTKEGAHEITADHTIEVFVPVSHEFSINDRVSIATGIMLIF